MPLSLNRIWNSHHLILIITRRIEIKIYIHDISHAVHSNIDGACYNEQQSYVSGLFNLICQIFSRQKLFIIYMQGNKCFYLLYITHVILSYIYFMIMLQLDKSWRKKMYAQANTKIYFEKTLNIRSQIILAFKAHLVCDHSQYCFLWTKISAHFTHRSNPCKKLSWQHLPAFL